MEYEPDFRPPVRTPAWTANAVTRIEDDDRIDLAARPLDPIARRVAAGRRGDILRGAMLGHALHPFVTDSPLGCWISAGLLDLVGFKRSRCAAQTLVGLGVVMAPAAVASGLADFASIEDRR